METPIHVYATMWSELHDSVKAMRTSGGVLLCLYASWLAIGIAEVHRLWKHADGFKGALEATFITLLLGYIAVLANLCKKRLDSFWDSFHWEYVEMAIIIGLQLAIVCILGFVCDRTAENTSVPIYLLFCITMVTTIVTVIAILPTPIQNIPEQFESIVRFTFDYAHSASIMLGVVSLLWGSNGIAGVVLAPILLWTALQCSSYMMYCNLGQKQPIPYGSKCLILFVLVVMYAVSLVPFLHASVSSITSTGDAANEATAPKFVLIIAISFACLFSLFVVPYILQLFYLSIGNDATKINNFYCVLSVVAKVVLHAFILLTVVQQAEMLSSNTPVSNTDVDSQLVYALTGTIVLGIIFGVIWTYRKTNAIWVHLWCAFFHFSTLFVGIYIAYAKGNHKQYTKQMSLSFWSVETWLYKCYDATNSSYTSQLDCPRDARLFFLADDVSHGRRYNYISAASAYVAISAFGHLIAARYTNANKEPPEVKYTKLPKSTGTELQF